MPSLLQSRGDFSLPSGRFASFLVAVPTDPTCLQFLSPVDPSLGLKTGFLAFPVLSKEMLVSQLSLPHKVAFGDIRLHLRSEVPRTLKTQVWMEPVAFPEPISHNPRLCHQRACPSGWGHLMTPQVPK